MSEHDDQYVRTATIDNLSCIIVIYDGNKSSFGMGTLGVLWKFGNLQAASAIETAKMYMKLQFHDRKLLVHGKFH